MYRLINNDMPETKYYFDSYETNRINEFENYYQIIRSDKCDC